MTDRAQEARTVTPPDAVEQALIREHRMRAWEHQMRGFKELTIALFVVMCMVALYVFGTKILHKLG